MKLLLSVARFILLDLKGNIDIEYSIFRTVKLKMKPDMNTFLQSAKLVFTNKIKYRKGLWKEVCRKAKE
jgi:hypothetical protein